MLLLALSQAPCLACVGARALSMGGAFTGIADDTQATYWNPAGLAHASAGIMTMHNINHRREFNYDDYVGISYKWKHWGIGAEYVKKSIQTRGLIVKEGQAWQLGEIYEQSSWFQIGGGFDLSVVSMGFNIRSLEKTIEVEGGSAHQPFYAKGGDRALAFDLGVLMEFGPQWKENARRMFSAGLLVQDVNKPELLGQEYIVNFRPGFGFRPLSTLVFSLEVYDATRQYFDQPQLRIGAEWVIKSPCLGGDVALRGGVYHLNEYSYRAVTGGFGYLRPLSGHTSIGLDYVFMRWQRVGKVTHLVSLVFKF